LRDFAGLPWGSLDAYESDDKKYTLTFETSKYAPQLSLTSFKETPDPLSPPGNDGDVPLKNSS